MKLHVIMKIHNCNSLSSHLKYQQYYLEGFRSIEKLNFQISPSWLDFSIAITAGRTRIINTLWKHLLSVKGRKQCVAADHVGRYTIKTAGKRQTRIAIDAADGRLIRDLEAYEWSDFYFKANMWPSLQYPKKTLPLINGDGYLDKARLKWLLQMRNYSNSCDLIYWAKIWEPGRTQYYSNEICRNIIEHQIKLFETMGKLECKKKLLAIFSDEMPLRSVDTQQCIRRLMAAGVDCQFGWGNIDSQTFWQNLAASKVVFIRPGNHLCISWRLIGLLCLGSCIVYDRAPFPQWYEPLTGARHYVDGDCGLGPDFSLPSETQYENFYSIIGNLLSDIEKIRELKAHAASYYDNFGSPVAVAEYILRTAGCMPTH
jgi:hypothetical protein